VLFSNSTGLGVPVSVNDFVKRSFQRILSTKHAELLSKNTPPLTISVKEENLKANIYIGVEHE